MKIIILILLIFYNFLNAQNGFHLKATEKKNIIPFELINNLIIIPVKINGVELKFLLDTGVENTIFFSLDENKEIIFKNAEKIKIRGLGSGQSLDAILSKDNEIEIKKIIDKKHSIYIILDQDVNFSSQLGIPIHGIIGYHFFRNHFVEINYETRQVIVYQNITKKLEKKIKNSITCPISIENQKPYISLDIEIEKKENKVKLLIDSGNSDALWLFVNDEIEIPLNNFEDFLGKGFSGEIFGKRSRINNLRIKDLILENPTVSFPEKKSLENIDLVIGRNGSIGAGILKKFNIIFDYRNKEVHFIKNSFFEQPFNYNMSGMEIQHSGLKYVEEKMQLQTTYNQTYIDLKEDIPKSFMYKFSLKPIYKITTLRKDSPAFLAGLKIGDEIIKINGNFVYKYKIQEITYLLQSEEGKWISLEYERNGKMYKTKFQLKKIL